VGATEGGKKKKKKKPDQRRSARFPEARTGKVGKKLKKSSLRPLGRWEEKDKNAMAYRKGPDREGGHIKRVIF